MASLLTWTEYGFAAQQGTDNAVLQAGLDLSSSYVMTGNGDLGVRSGGTILGGKNNVGSNTVNSSVWSGNSNNTFNSRASFIGSGANNRTSGNESSVGGGYNNDALNENSAVAGGKDGTANNSNAIVLGGLTCLASNNCTIACGNTSNATGDRAICVGDRNISSNLGTVVFGGSSSNATTNRSVVLGGYSAKATGTENAAAVGGFAPTANTGVSATVVGGYVCGSLNSYTTAVGGRANELGRYGGGIYGTAMGGYNHRVSGTSAVLGGSGVNTYAEYNVIMGPANITSGELTNPSFEIAHSSGTARHASRVHFQSTVSSTNGSRGFTLVAADGIYYIDTCIVGIRADGAQGCSIRIQAAIRKPSGNAVFCTGRSGFANPVVTVYTRDASTYNASGSLSGNQYIIAFNGPTAAGVTYRWAIHSNIAYRAK